MGPWITRICRHNKTPEPSAGAELNTDGAVPAHRAALHQLKLVRALNPLADGW
jgi:hypothetical protein